MTWSAEDVQQESAKGGALYFLGRSVDILSRLVLQLVLTRGLGAHSYGVYSLGRSISSLLSQASMLGMNNALVKYIPEQKATMNLQAPNGTFRLVFLVVGVTSILGSICLFLVSSHLARDFFEEESLETTLMIFSVSIPFMALITLVGFAARSIRKPRDEVTLVNLVWPTLTILCVTVALMGARDLGGASWGFTGGCIVTGGIAIGYLGRLWPRRTDGTNLTQPERKILLKYALVVFLPQLLVVATGQLDRIVVGHYVGVEDVGQYTICLIIANNLNVFLLALSTILGPIVSDVNVKKRLDILQNLYRASTRWMITLTVPMFCILVVYAREILSIFGPEFSAGWCMLTVLAVGQLVNVSVGCAGVILIMAGKQNIELVNSVTVSIGRVMMYVLLIGHFGAMGAAVATTLGVIMINLARLVQVRSIFKLRPYDKGTVWIFFSGVLASGGAYCVKGCDAEAWFRMAMGIFTFALIYGGMIVARGLHSEDRYLLSVVESRLRTQG